tara:strand:- start:224 stop:1675 length:1452 start_codon:yes stop_codon:yes gene_type:complete
MTAKLINIEYFKRGISLNILQVSSSLALGLVTSIMYFSLLSGKDFVIYTLIQLTVFFFVNFSSLELNQYIRKYIPVMDNDKSLLFLAKILVTVIRFFLAGILIYYFVLQYSNIYSTFEESKNLIYVSIFVLSIIQIFASFISTYISAQEKFDLIEKKYFYFLTPYKVTSIIFFYFFSSNLITAIVLNFFLRSLQLILIINFLERKKLFKHILNKKPEIKEFNLKKNIKFTTKNFLYMNYPLLFLSLIPTYLSKSYSLDDVAVFTLVLTLFNSIKPILHAISTLINPSIVNLKNMDKTRELNLIIRITINIVVTLHVSGILIIWLHLNYDGFTEFFLQYFSYNLFSDFINSILVISLFSVLTMIQQSYYLASSYETKFFVTSFLATFLSIGYIIIFVLQELNLNFVLGVLVVFYCVKYFLSLYLTYDSIKFSFITPLGVIILFPFSLITFKFDNFTVYMISLLAILLITIYLIIKLYNQLKTGK